MSRPVRRRSLLTWPLVLALVAGLGVVNWALFTGPPPPAVPALDVAAGDADGTVTAVPATSFETPPIDRFEEILRRPLFAASRRPPDLAAAQPVSEPPAPAPAAEPSAPPNFRLSGVMIRKKSSRALIVPADGSASAWLAVGESIEGWKVRSITTSSVRLEGGGQVVTLDLYGGAAKSGASSAN